MTKVVVIGGGVAGIAAALTASNLGAETTLVESSARVGLSRASMPLVISEERSEDDLVLPEAGSLKGAGVDVKTGATVMTVSHGEKKLEFGGGAGALRYDSVVVCTGSASLTPSLRGVTKPNAYVLSGPADYLAFSRSLDNMTTVAVAGPVPLALKIGEAIAIRGRRAMVFCGRGGLVDQFSAPVAKMVQRESKAFPHGLVTIVDDSVDSILGVRKVEAVSSAGAVMTCDGVAVVPGSVPTAPEVECEKGSSGGLLVDRSMATDLVGVYAAGDSAEIRFKSGSVPARLSSTSRLGGEVAGTNASGGRAEAFPSWVAEQTYFGVEFCSAGLTLRDASAVGARASVGSWESGRYGSGGDESTASMVYDVETHEVYGIQIGGRGALSLSNAASMVISLGLKLDQLVRMEWPYSPGSIRELSPIPLTAARILAADRT